MFAQPADTIIVSLSYAMSCEYMSVDGDILIMIAPDFLDKRLTEHKETYQGLYTTSRFKTGQKRDLTSKSLAQIALFVP
jgi:hypothetical protein